MIGREPVASAFDGWPATGSSNHSMEVPARWPVDACATYLNQHHWNCSSPTILANNCCHCYSELPLSDCTLDADWQVGRRQSTLAAIYCSLQCPPLLHHRYPWGGRDSVVQSKHANKVCVWDLWVFFGLSKRKNKVKNKKNGLHKTPQKRYWRDTSTSTRVLNTGNATYICREHQIKSHLADIEVHEHI